MWVNDDVNFYFGLDRCMFKSYIKNAILKNEDCTEVVFVLLIFKKILFFLNLFTRTDINE